MLIVLSPLLLVVWGWLTFANKETVARWRTTALLSTSVTYVSTLPSASVSVPCISPPCNVSAGLLANRREWHFVQHSHKGARCFSLALKGVETFGNGIFVSRLKID